MSKVLTAATGAVLGVATWFLLFVILGTGLGTAFIALGAILAAGLIGAGMIVSRSLDTPLTSVGLLAGVATFAVLEIVLSVPMWVGVVTGLAVIGLYDLSRGMLLESGPEARTEMPPRRRTVSRAASNGSDRYEREPVGVH